MLAAPRRCFAGEKAGEAGNDHRPWGSSTPGNRNTERSPDSAHADETCKGDCSGREFRLMQFPVHGVIASFRPGEAAMTGNCALARSPAGERSWTRLLWGASDLMRASIAEDSRRAYEAALRGFGASGDRRGDSGLPHRTV